MSSSVGWNGEMECGEKSGSMIVNANAFRIPLADKSVQVCVTSPPYYNLRDYSQCECITFFSSDVKSSTLNGGGNVHLSNHSQRRKADPNCPYCHGMGRDERMDAQLGLESTPDEYIANLVSVGREIWRVLRDDGTFWLNLGDSYFGSSKGQGGVLNSPKQRSNPGSYFGKPLKTTTTSFDNRDLKPKDLMMIPARVALALREMGWYLRAEIVWGKKNPMPESVTDRPTRSHEMIYLFTKRATYYYDAEAVKETATGYDGRKDTRMKGSTKYANGFVPGQSAQTVAVRGHERWQKRKNDGTGYGGNGTGLQGHSGYSNVENPYVRNQRDVWFLATEPYSGAHYATFPTEIPRRAILAGTSAKGHCPKCGKGWMRVIERIPGHSKSTPKTQSAHEARLGSGNPTGTVGKSGGSRVEGQSMTLDWQPSCKCGVGDTIPAIVLDPFCGSGTTGEVCRELEQRFIGLDLSMKYLRENALPRAELKQTADSIARLPLFGWNGDEPQPLKQDTAGNPTMVGFNALWKDSHKDA